MPARLKLALGIKEQRAKASPGQPADAFYLTHIQPVFDDSCVVCHGSRKKKAGLNMESYADLVKGGENGPVVAVANVEKSELYRRITLGGDRKEFMPSEGTKPLSKAQVILIKQWIASGPRVAQKFAPGAPRVVACRRPSGFPSRVPYEHSRSISPGW